MVSSSRNRSQSPDNTYSMNNSYNNSNNLHSISENSYENTYEDNSYEAYNIYSPLPDTDTVINYGNYAEDNSIAPSPLETIHTNNNILTVFDDSDFNNSSSTVTGLPASASGFPSDLPNLAFINGKLQPIPTNLNKNITQKSISNSSNSNSSNSLTNDTDAAKSVLDNFTTSYIMNGDEKIPQIERSSNELSCILEEDSMMTEEGSSIGRMNCLDGNNFFSPFLFTEDDDVNMDGSATGDNENNNNNDGTNSGLPSPFKTDPFSSASNQARRMSQVQMTIDEAEAAAKIKAEQEAKRYQELRDKKFCSIGLKDGTELTEITDRQIAQQNQVLNDEDGNNGINSNSKVDINGIGNFLKNRVSSDPNDPNFDVNDPWAEYRGYSQKVKIQPSSLGGDGSVGNPLKLMTRHNPKKSELAKWHTKETQDEQIKVDHLVRFVDEEVVHVLEDIEKVPERTVRHIVEFPTPYFKLIPVPRTHYVQEQRDRPSQEGLFYVRENLLDVTTDRVEVKTKKVHKVVEPNERILVKEHPELVVLDEVIEVPVKKKREIRVPRIVKEDIVVTKVKRYRIKEEIVNIEDVKVIKKYKNVEKKIGRKVVKRVPPGALSKLFEKQKGIDAIHHKEDIENARIAKEKHDREVEAKLEREAEIKSGKINVIDAEFGGESVDDQIKRIEKLLGNTEKELKEDLPSVSKEEIEKLEEEMKKDGVNSEENSSDVNSSPEGANEVGDDVEMMDDRAKYKKPVEKSVEEELAEAEGVVDEGEKREKEEEEEADDKLKGKKDKKKGEMGYNR